MSVSHSPIQAPRYHPTPTLPPPLAQQPAWAPAWTYTLPHSSPPPPCVQPEWDPCWTPAPASLSLVTPHPFLHSLGSGLDINMDTLLELNPDTDLSNPVGLFIADFHSGIGVLRRMSCSTAFRCCWPLSSPPWVT